MGYKLLKHKFSMALEDGWQDQSVYRFTGPELDGLTHYINIGLDNVEPSLDVNDYAEMYLQSLQSSLAGFRLLKQGPVKMFNHNRAFEIVYDWCPDGQSRYLQRCLFVKKQPRRIYILSTTFTPQSWSKLGTTLDNMMRSFC